MELLESAQSVLKELLSIKTALGIVISYILYKGLNAPCKDCKNIKEKIHQNETNTDTNKINIQNIKENVASLGDDVKGMRSDNKSLQANLYNYFNKFEQFKNETYNHHSIKPKQKINILIFDDDPKMADILRRKILECGESFHPIIVTDFKNAMFELMYGGIKIILCDLMHDNGFGKKEPVGLDVYNTAQQQTPYIKFIMISEYERPENYHGIFIRKNIRNEDLNQLLKIQDI